MLIQFNFKNYKSFKDEATLDLSAAKMTEFSERVVCVGSEKFFRLQQYMVQMQVVSQMSTMHLNT
ncbi:hypothetical protein [Lacrimispora xylanisolvens]|uniref:hypothetical protein n=1 Tax=Lacrimispora xylanisolvens TaxID=384636 RepID=UPI0032E80066